MYFASIIYIELAHTSKKTTFQIYVNKITALLDSPYHLS